jgi:hypothetical protein
MKNPNIYNEEDCGRGSFHSQICVADTNDFIYRKAYKGDWGHWDDLPDNAAADENNCDMEENSAEIL